MNQIATEKFRTTRNRLKLRREIAKKSDGYFVETRELVTSFLKEKPDLKINQIRGLENVAYSTDAVSDILDLVERQIGRKLLPMETGQDLLDRLNRLQDDAKYIAQKIDYQDSDLPRRVHLLLCREYIKHLAAHFEYQARLNKEKERL